MRSTVIIALCMVSSGCSTEADARRSRDRDAPEVSRGRSPGGETSAAGEDPGPPEVAQALRGLGLEQAFALAEEMHPDLAAARARVEAASGRALQAGLYPNPVGVLRMESAPFRGRTTGDAEYVAGISVPLDLGGRTSAARRAEDRERERAEEEQEATRREVRMRVQGAFAAALYAQRALEAQSSAAEMSATGLLVTRALASSGEAVAADLAMAEIDALTARREVETARSLRDVAILRLAAAVGDPRSRIESLDGSLEAAIELPALESVATQLEAHPAVRAADAAVDAGRARVVLAEAHRIPQVNLDLFYRRLEHSEENAFDVGLSIPLPIFDRGQGRLREAMAETSAAEALARGVRNDLAERLHEAHAAVSRALASARVLREEVIPRMDVVLRATEARYAAGDVRILEAIAVRREDVRARLAYLQSLRDLMEAWARLSPFLQGA